MKLIAVAALMLAVGVAGGAVGGWYFGSQTARIDWWHLKACHPGTEVCISLAGVITAKECYALAKDLESPDSQLRKLSPSGELRCGPR